MGTETSPPIQVRRSAERFHSDHGWLNSWHTFSFADHYDPAFAGYEHLRVINDDTVAAKMGFGEHAHRDMEIISYVISGQLQHRDSMGNGRVIKPGDFQYMSAGSGVTHSEFNPSDTEPVHFLQIWIIPAEKGAKPRYQEKSILETRTSDGLTLVASGDGRDDSIAIRQDADLYFGHLGAGKSVEPKLPKGKTWLHVIKGTLEVAGERLQPGDGAAIDGTIASIGAQEESEFLLFAL